MRHICDTIMGLFALFLLGARTGFRLRGSYWQWRYETAMGTDATRRPSKGEQFRAILDYARWLHRMKRHRH